MVSRRHSLSYLITVASQEPNQWLKGGSVISPLPLLPPRHIDIISHPVSFSLPPLSHTHTHTRTLSLLLAYTHTNTPSLSHRHAFILSHTCPLLHTHRLCLFALLTALRLPSPRCKAELLAMAEWVKRLSASPLTWPRRGHPNGCHGHRPLSEQMKSTAVN